MSEFMDMSCKYLELLKTVDDATNAFNAFNDEIRRYIKNEIFNRKPSEQELEIQKILLKEKEQYEKYKVEFYADPIHWSNNKRKQHGLPVLRGKTNKNRNTKFHSFKPTPRVFFVIEDIIDKTIGDKFNNNNFFNRFVEVKDLKIGDNVVWVQ